MRVTAAALALGISCCLHNDTRYIKSTSFLYFLSTTQWAVVRYCMKVQKIFVICVAAAALALGIACCLHDDTRYIKSTRFLYLCQGLSGL